MTKEDEFFAGFDPPVLKVDPIGPQAELKSKVFNLEAQLRQQREAVNSLNDELMAWRRDTGALQAQVAQLQQEREAHVRELSRYASIEEKAHLQTIDERDAAEDALSQAYYLIKGASPQWSNLFGYQQALEDIDDFQKCVRAELKTSEAQAAQLQATISQLEAELEPYRKWVAGQRSKEKTDDAG